MGRNTQTLRMISQVTPPSLSEDLTHTGKNHKYRFRALILWPLALLLSILIAAFIFASAEEEEEHIEGDAQLTFQAMAQSYDSAVAQETEKLKAAAEIILQDDVLRAALAANNRTALLHHALPLFERLHNNHQVTHFYFHALNRVNLLRVHEPKRFGDKIDRFTLLQAEASGKVFAGLELGPLGTFTLRVVFPWHEHGRLIGYLELGEEIDHVIHRLYGNTGTNLFLTIDKRFLNRTEWERSMRLLGHNTDWNLLPSAVVIHRAAKSIPQPILNILEHRSGPNIQQLSLGKQQLWFSIMLLRDAAKHEVGHLMIMRDMTARIDSNRRNMLFLGSLSAGLGTLLLAFFYLLTGKVEKELESRRLRLIQQAHEREKFQLKYIGELEETHTALTQAKESAEQAGRAKSAFLSRVSHELRTPMNAILGFAQLMAGDKEDPLNPAQAENLGEILKAGWHLNALINDLLDLTRIDAGKLQLNMEATELGPLIQECEQLAAPMAANRHIHFLSDPGEYKFHSVNADPLRLKQVLLNLISNAIKYNQENGSITISCDLTNDNKMRILVKDTGKGIPPEKFDQLFTPFSRLDADKLEIEGDGIGLTISKQLIELMGGSIGATSEVGVGSTFWIDLQPANADAQQQQEALSL